MLENIKKCPYCVRSRIHARRHKKVDGEYSHPHRKREVEQYTLCLPHRVLSWLSSNAYHEGNVKSRNPSSASDYRLRWRKIPIPEKDENYLYVYTNIGEEDAYQEGFPLGEYLYKFYSVPPRFKFSIIAKGELYIIKYPHTNKDKEEEFLLLRPSVIADVVEGEYTNRGFAIIFGVWDEGEEDYEWGLLESNISYFFHYVGYNSLYAIENTCVWGKAEPNPKPSSDIKYFSQRKSCEECKNKKTI